MTSFDIPKNLVYASFFFIDIVGLSNPKMHSLTQSTKISILNQYIANSNTFKNHPNGDLIILPTGDGMAIGFIHGIEKSIELAKEIHEQLNKYNKDKELENKIQVRIGCHIGNVFIVKDVFGDENYWGPGLIFSRRAMDIGSAGHILVTSTMAEELFELSQEYEKIIHPIHDYKLKHDEVLLIYSVFGHGFGNPKKPVERIYERERSGEFTKMKKAVFCKNIEFSLSLKDSNSNLVEHKRRYDLINNSDEPIYEITNGIITNIKKSIQDLEIRILDDKKRELFISSINLDAEYRKEFTIRLNNPIVKGEKNRNYTLTYKIEEPNRTYENLFLINSGKLICNFEYRNSDNVMQPKFFVIEKHNREKKLVKSFSEKNKKGVTHLQWIKNDGIHEKDMIRIEW